MDQARRRFALLPLALVLSAGGVIHAVSTVGAANITIPTPACGLPEFPLAATGSWVIPGGGVPVYSNGPTDEGGGADCASGFNMVGGVKSGEKWQCAEFINRLYLTKGWIQTTWAGDAGQPLWNNTPAALKSEMQANGSVTYLGPGDVVIINVYVNNVLEEGHALIVNSASDVTGGGVNLVSQNSGLAASSEPVQSGTLSGGSVTVGGGGHGYSYKTIGVVHAPTAPPPLITNYTASTISGPGGIVSGPDGALWFTNDGNNSIGRITVGGKVTNYTASSISDPVGIAVGADGALWFTNSGNNSIGRIATAGKVTNYTAATISAPQNIASASDGALWFTNGGNNSIGRITTAGKVTNYAGHGVSDPDGITVGSDGALWFTNADSIGRITTGGAITTYSGGEISHPSEIAAGPDGALWFANEDHASIGRITTSGKVTDYTGADNLSPYGLATGPDGAVWFADDNASIGRITTTGVVTTYTGTGILFPYAIVAGPDANLWFTNDGNNSIGRITTA